MRLVQQQALLFIALALVQVTYAQSREEVDLTAAYTRANDLQKLAENAVFKADIHAHWIDGTHFCYRNDLKDGVHEYVLVDAVARTKKPPFDPAKLGPAITKAIGKQFDGTKLDIEITKLTETGFEFRLGVRTLNCEYATYNVAVVATDTSHSFVRQRQNSNAIRIDKGEVEIRKGDTWAPVTKLGAYDSFTPSEQPNKILALRMLPGDHKKLYLLHSTGPNNANGGKTRATLEERLYDQPGDQMDRFEPVLVDTAAKTETKIEMDPILGGSYPWPGPPGVESWHGKWLIAHMVRGNQEFRVAEIDQKTGAVTTPIDEKAETFIDNAHTLVRTLQNSDQFLFQSERSGWSRLYRYDSTGRMLNPVTPDNGVFRELLDVDEKAGQIYFTGNDYDQKQDPYQIHAYRANLQTGETIDLTPGDGEHRVTFSPDHAFLVDTYSRVDMPPVHELRRASDGSLVMELERADASQLYKNGMVRPQRFVAKGRDGQTDIWGVVMLPSNFDKRKRYPIIEDIYAGPHDSFVPKSFAPFFNMQRLAELGLVVVQIDGMGTSNRGKKFHDVCWKNVADAGFPDRILWMQALAKHIPQIDLTRVGVYGTSAGGQDAANAVLFHPEFYKVAVASCGCYDNRIDKQWWNEQWMGYPVGPWYADQAAANHVQNLKGHLMLFVGEDDHNVPPESTYQLVDALIKSKKEFDMLVLPGFDHTDGGPYGERKRRDFFVRWLLGKTPPNWNAAP